MDTNKDLPKPGSTGQDTGKDDTSPLGAAGESLEFTPSATDGASEPKTSGNNPGDTLNPAVDSEDDQSSAEVTSAITPGKPAKAPRTRFKAFWERVNIYMLLFIFILAVSLVVIAVIFFKHRSESTAPAESLTQQQLSTEALQELADSGVQVGDPKQVLSVQSNAVFAGTVLVKGELQVAGGLKIGGGGLTIPDVVVGGTAIINQVQAQNLAVAGNGAIQGQLTVQQNLSVNGSGSFNGAVTTPSLTTGKLQLSGDLVLTRHLVAGGSIPGRTNGGNLGTGGTSSISGSDTAGTVTINTGSGAAAGCMVTVIFSQAFSSTPHVNITPVGSGAASLGYYINRSTSNFSICTTNAPPSNQSFGFDYMALE